MPTSPEDARKALAKAKAKKAAAKVKVAPAKAAAKGDDPFSRVGVDLPKTLASAPKTAPANASASEGFIRGLIPKRPMPRGAVAAPRG